MRRKRLIEILCLASFIVIFSITNTNSHCTSENVIQAENIETSITDRHSYFVKKHATKYFDEGQEEIRNEIFYGEIEEAVLVVQAEAGNQDELGKRYVADVIFNRVDSDDFPDTIHDVLYQKEPVQFATVFNGAIDIAAYEVTEDVFRIVLEEYFQRVNSEIIYFRTGKYHDCGTPAFKHGDHYFSK